MPRTRHDHVRGLLTLPPGVTVVRYFPALERVAAFVEHYWIVRWDMAPDEVFTSETLPYPSVHVVFEQSRCYVQGVTTGKFTRSLREAGYVFGIKFHPGGFRPLISDSVSRLTDRVLAVDEVLPFARDFAPDGTDAEMVAAAEALLAEHLPPPDPTVTLITGLCNRIAEDRSIIRVDQVAEQAAMRKRALERLFADYVGVSPKWVIQRYRLFEAAERLATAESTGAALAAELGYFDQAHFIRDFKRVVGATPQSFARSR